MMLCPFKKYDLYLPRVTELFWKAVVRHFTTHSCEALLLSGFQCYLGVFMLFLVAFHLLWESCFGNNQMFQHFVGFQKKYYLFLYHPSSLQLWFHSL